MVFKVAETLMMNDILHSLKGGEDVKMGKEMTDEQKIEQAATEYGKEHEPKKGMWAALCEDFKAGIQWRDENPSPEALALVEALNTALNYLSWRADDLVGDDLKGDGLLTARYNNRVTEIKLALAEWEKK